MTTKGELLDVIRRTCLRCCCGSYKEVQNCGTTKAVNKDYEKCPLYPFRLGNDPTAAKGGRNPFLKKETPCVSINELEIKEVLCQK